jgi:ribonuclease BN (tRNA processing enzyme)
MFEPQIKTVADLETRGRINVGPFAAVLANGIFGDPLLHVRLKHRRRSFLLDLGEASALPARIAHRTADIFVSHTHIDHIAGFLWLLRARIGDFPPCRLYGPPELSANIAGLVAGVCWDRAGTRGPRFEVAELDAERLTRFAVSTETRVPQPISEETAAEGVILTEPGLRVRAATLDHGTPVLAFALEPERSLKVREDVLIRRALVPGPWLTALKSAIARGQRDLAIQLPNGETHDAGALASELLLIEPGEKLVYATDLADTPDNRGRLVELARGAHTLFCEATFLEADAAQAERTGHLTARACGEIAAAAGVGQLVPFHFSLRYRADPLQVYREVAAACPQTRVPRAAAGRASK